MRGNCALGRTTETGQEGDATAADDFMIPETATWIVDLRGGYYAGER